MAGWPIVCLFVCLSGRLSGWLAAPLSVCLSGWLSGWLAAPLSVCLSVCLAGYLAGWLPHCLSVCLFVWMAGWPIVSLHLFVCVQFVYQAVSPYYILLLALLVNVHDAQACRNRELISTDAR